MNTQTEIILIAVEDLSFAFNELISEKTRVSSITHNGSMTAENQPTQKHYFVVKRPSLRKPDMYS